MNSLTLTKVNSLNDIPKKLRKLEPAHTSRYLITATLLKQIIGITKYPKILDVGGKKGLLREFGIKSTVIDIEESDEKDYIQGDALNMPFPDNHFDVVTSCDVLEHIGKKDRQKFISEMVRVSKGYVVICAPFDDDGVSAAEVESNKFYKSVANDDHRWLGEHIANGLPNKALVEGYLKADKLSYQFFRHLSLDVWDATTKIHLLDAVFGDSTNINALAKETYDKYYATLCDIDFSETGYRTFCVINKSHPFTIDLPSSTEQKKAKSEYHEFLNTNLISSLKGVAADRRSANLNVVELQDKINELNVTINKKSAELSEIKQSKAWKLVQKARRVKSMGHGR